MQNPIDITLKRAILLGASGLVGKEVLMNLLEDPDIEMVVSFAYNPVL